MAMLPDLLIGSIIILVPLGILILIIAIDLDSKERQLSRRIKKLNVIAGSLTKKKTTNLTDLNSLLDGFELDKQDKEQVDMLANETDTGNNEKHDIANAIIENYALAAKKVATMRFKEKMMLATKIRYFKIYATFMYVLIWISLGILPLLYKLGFNWDWK
jgi:hypothetical protein